MKRITAIFSLLLLCQQVAFAIGPEITGSWYNKNESGHGFSIEYGDAGNGTPLVAVYWYVYDKDGNPVFLTGTGYPDETGVDITFYAHYGMKFGVFDPATHQEQDGGVARFTFQDDKNGTFEYFPSVWITENFGHSHHQMPITKLFAVKHPYVEPPPTGEPVPLPGFWSGRMTYDRRSAAGGACYDADVQVGVGSTSSGIKWVDSITVSPDNGGRYINSNLNRTFNLAVSGYITVNGNRIDYTINFGTYGSAQGVWAYDNSECYGDWSFTKD